MTLGVNDYIFHAVGYPRGQCTSFAYDRVVRDLGRPDFAPSWHGGFFGNADSWASAAIAAGLPVGSVPHRGDVVEFNPGVDGASNVGHVAVVLASDTDRVYVEDYNWNDTQQYAQHWVQAAGLRFITFLPAGQTIEGDDVLTPSAKDGLVRLAYLAALGREPEAMANEAAWAGQIHDNGDNLDAVIAQIADNPEGVAWRAAVRALIAKATP
jgi:surface antigen